MSQETQDVEQIVEFHPLVIAAGSASVRPPKRDRAPQRAPEPNGLLTIQQAAARLAMSERTLRQHIKTTATLKSSSSARERSVRTLASPPKTLKLSNTLSIARWNPSHVSLPRQRLAVTSSSTSGRRSSLFRLDQVQGPARSGSGRAHEREKAKRHVDRRRGGGTSLRLDDVAGRYWQEVGQHHAGADNTERQMSSC